MDGQNQDGGEVIHFKCDQCQTSLTVDDSLAGVTGPCPSCGQLVTAPVSRAPRSIVVQPREAKRRSNIEKEEASPEVSKQNSESSQASRKRGRRAVSPNTGLSEAHKEKGELVSIFKMLIAALLVLGVVLVVAYFLNAQFQSA